MNNATSRCEFQAGRTSDSRANQAGFSISELTWMMAVVAVLFTMAAPNFVKARKQSQANGFAKEDQTQVQSYVLKLVVDPDAESDGAAGGTLAGMASHSKRAFSWVPVAPSDEPWNWDSEQDPAKTGSDTSGVTSALAGAGPFRQGLDPYDPRVRDVRSRSGGFVSAVTK